MAQLYAITRSSATDHTAAEQTEYSQTHDPPFSLPLQSEAYTYREVICVAFHVVIMEIILHYHKRFV